RLRQPARRTGAIADGAAGGMRSRGAEVPQAGRAGWHAATKRAHLAAEPRQELEGLNEVARHARPLHTFALELRRTSRSQRPRDRLCCLTMDAEVRQEMRRRWSDQWRQCDRASAGWERND